MEDFVEPDRTRFEPNRTYVNWRKYSADNTLFELNLDFQLISAFILLADKAEPKPQGDTACL
jgi:hypothetical protein